MSPKKKAMKLDFPDSVFFARNLNSRRSSFGRFSHYASVFSFIGLILSSIYLILTINK